MTGGGILGGTSLRAGVAAGLLALALIGAVVVDLAAPARPREFAVAGSTAGGATDELGLQRSRGGGEGAAALGAAAARAHAPSVAGAPQVAAFLKGRRGGSIKRRLRRAQVAARWISKAPRGGSEGRRR